MPNTHILNHPITNSIIAMLRDKNTKCGEFRALMHRLAQFEAYEALRDFPTVEKALETPLEATTAKVIDEDRICLVPILRAGLGLSEGISEVLPGAHVGHIGMYRDEQTCKAHLYYSRFPKGIEDMEVLLLDPMLATGGSAVDAVKILRDLGVKHIRFICVIAAPEGVQRFEKEFPDIPLFVGALDRELNENSYILPGLGDAGDRIFGTIL